MAAALWRLANGNPYRCIGVALWTSCAALYATQFCNVLYGKRPEYIKFPADLTTHKFSKRTKIPNVVSAIDRSHIKEPVGDQV